MGANLLIFASTLFLPPFQYDSTDKSKPPPHEIGSERLSDALEYNRLQRYGFSDERVTRHVSIV
jgi:hypothetical protein